MTRPDGRVQAIAQAFEAACRDELAAPKPGNVHVFAGGHRMTAEDFERSAHVAAGPLTAAGARVGARILGAVEATVAAVGANTNLGIVLLCAPLAKAAEMPGGDLRASLAAVLRDLDVEDAALAFRAITRAAPAGLGRAEKHDVFAPATVTLREAMAEAARYDRIACQYVSDFADVFDLGLARRAASRAALADPRLATLMIYLGFLAAFRDSHIVRKHGEATADRIREQASILQRRVDDAHSLDAVLPELLAWDAALKREGVNPGTSADLTVATIFTQRLRCILPPAVNSG